MFKRFLPTSRRFLRQPRGHLRAFSQSQLQMTDSDLEFVKRINEDPQQVDSFLRQFDQNVLNRIQEQIFQDDTLQNDTVPTTRQLYLTATQAAIPFIGFGFLDNALMIMFGASIEASVGLSFNLTVMAAAAIGNTFSDMGGVFMGTYVEHLAEKLNLPKANLSDKQKTYRSAKFADVFGSCFGVLIGCILGMIPLLFYSQTADMTHVKNAFEKLDKDKSGTIDREEIQAVMDVLGLRAVDKYMDGAFRKYDSDGDGHLDFQEFLLLLQDVGIVTEKI